MVDPDSDRISRVPPYLGYRSQTFAISGTGLSPPLAGFPNAVPLCRTPSCRGPATPPFRMVWAPPVPLAATPGISFDFCSRGTEMVQFPQCRFRALCVQYADTRPLKYSNLYRLLYPSLKYFSGRVGYPIRLPADRWICAPPRRFSQLVAAFFAKIRPGIRREPSSRLTILSF